MMEANLFPVLPGFRMHRDFFALLGENFEPVALEEEEKRRYERQISELMGVPTHEFRQLRADLKLTASVREARRYSEGRLFVRFEFRRLEPDCDWSGPRQLMAVFDEHGALVAYTVMRDRDAVGKNLVYRITHRKYKWDAYDTTKDIHVALSVLGSEADSEVAVCDAESNVPLLYVYAGMGPSRRGFDVERYIGCEPWLMARTNVDLSVVQSMIESVKAEGMRGLSKDYTWQQFDFAESYRKHGVRFGVDEELKRALLLAQREGDQMVESTVRAVGVGDDPISDAYEIRVAPASERGLLNNLFNMSLKDGVSDLHVCKLLAYLAIRGVVPAMNNLGYVFHFGKGVVVDYDLAEYWHLRGAEKGSVACMLSLGKIYSEKTSPKWNGPKAIEWLEKAVAHNDSWAKGELAHCILCGECIQQDLKRAEQLLIEAVAESPDRKDFAEDLRITQSGETQQE